VTLDASQGERRRSAEADTQVSNPAETIRKGSHLRFMPSF
jgi:hypothetical protein